MLSYTKEILRFLSQEQILNGEAFFIYIDEKGEKKISLNLTNTTATQFEFIRMKFLHAIRSAYSRNFFFLFLEKPSFHCSRYKFGCDQAWKGTLYDEVVNSSLPVKRI